jgi:thiol-disulfide isomerase/thioredoxin
MAALVKEIQAADWRSQVLDAAEPVVVDFYSSECPPCEALAPRLEAAAAALAGRARIVKVFRQANRELAIELGVLGSPTLLFFRGGAEVAPRHTGGQIGSGALVKLVEGLIA